jgi:hypothetical protein
MNKGQANEKWNKFCLIEPGSWNKRLRSYSFPYYYMPLTRKLVRLVRKGYNEETFPEICLEIRKHIEFDKWIYNDPDSLVKPDNFMMRLNTGSPKDSMNIDMNGKPLPFFNFEQALKAVMTSAKCQEDLKFLELVNKAAFVFTAFYSFPPSSEWRLFVLDGETVGISQINIKKAFPDMTEEMANNHAAKILSVFDQIKPLIDAKSYSIDFVCMPGMTSMIDINPYNDSDPLLFEDTQKIDGRLLYLIKSEE